MRSPDSHMIRAMSDRAGGPAIEVEVGGNVFTVRTQRGRVFASCPFQGDGSRFRIEVANPGRSEFRISLLEAPPKTSAVLLCDLPNPGWGSAQWGWRDTLDLDRLPIPAPSFRPLAEDAITAITLAAPRMCEAARTGEMQRDMAMLRKAGCTAERAETAARQQAAQNADAALEHLVGGDIGQSDPPRAAVVSAAVLSAIREAASAGPLPSAAAQLQEWGISGIPDLEDDLDDPWDGIRTRTVSAAGLRPSRADGAAADLCLEDPPVGEYLVYNLGARVLVEMADPADPQSVVDEASLWAGERRCFLLFGGRSVRFSKISQIADPDMRDVAGLLLLAREIALTDIAEAAQRSEEEAAAAEEDARQAAGRQAEQLGARAASLAAGRETGSAQSGAGDCDWRAPGDDLDAAHDNCNCSPGGRQSAGENAPVALMAQPYVRDGRRAPARTSGDTALESAAAAGVVASIACAVAMPAILPLPIAVACLAAVASGVRAVLKRRVQSPQAAAAAAPGDGDPAAALAAAALRASGRMPAASEERLRRVCDGIRDGLALASAAPVGDQDAYIIREAALRYVPEAIEGYLALPAGAPATRAGRTPEQEFDYQIGLIESRVRRVLDASTQDRVDDFDAHGRFLRDRLESPSTGALAIPPAAEAKHALSHA